MFVNDIETPGSEIENRIQQLQIHLLKQGIEGALILQNTDLFYFAGTIQQSYLYVPAQGSPILMAKNLVKLSVVFMMMKVSK